MCAKLIRGLKCHILATLEKLNLNFLCHIFVCYIIYLRSISNYNISIAT